MRRSTLRRTFVAALAASAMITSTAAAQQDLRGEQAQEAARLAAVKQDLRGEHARDAARGIDTSTVVAKPPVYWSYKYAAGAPTLRAVSARAHKPADDNGDLWLILGIALSAAGVVAISALAVGRRTRVRATA